MIKPYFKVELISVDTATPITTIKLSGYPTLRDVDPAAITRFIIEGLDSTMPSESQSLGTERLRAALLIKDVNGHISSDLGEALLDARRRVMAYLNEHATDDDTLEFMQLPDGSFNIRILCAAPSPNREYQQGYLAS